MGSNLLFLIITVAAVGLFVWQIKKIRRNIGLGRDVRIAGDVATRLRKVALVAFGQQKMFKRPWPAVLHGVAVPGK